MRFKTFKVKNFKGIRQIRFDFEAKPQSSIYTLVGLNESGKTTILEALDYLTGVYADSQDSLRALNSAYSELDPYTLLPIGKRAIFNDIISVEATYSLDEQDKKALCDFLVNKLGFVQANSTDEIVVERRHTFEDSKIKPGGTSSYWTVNVRGSYRKTGKRKLKEKDLAASGETREDWLKVVEFLKKLLPPAIYFPNFLFDFPNKIYLEDKENTTTEEARRDRTYRTVLQDVLDAVGKGADLSRHVLARAKSSNRHDQQALESVVLSMDGHMTRTVFGNWDKIFGRKPGDRQIVTNCDIDEDGRCFLRLRIKNNNQFYEINELSLGFRWFFSFLLLTQYRGFRRDVPKNMLFLLDEPASNLHQSAQRQLLGSFDKVENCSIVYTTHSHHMINPAWLESTYVVKNAGLDYNDEGAYNARETDITLTKYRVFADEHPNQTTYFQPILDVLDYRAGELENLPDVVMVEGKNDFYTLMYFRDKVLGVTSPNLMPGNGSGSLESVMNF